MIERAFDFIAMPKGSYPGGPVQASDGRWYIVTPLHMALSETIGHVRQSRKGFPVTEQEMTDALDKLRQEALEEA